MDTKLNTIKQFLKNNNCEYDEIDNEIFINNIYELFINNKHFEPTQPIEYTYIAFYYTLTKNNTDNVVAYHNYAINKGYNKSLYHLGNYYKNNVEISIMYYEMAHNKGINVIAYKIGDYYCDIKKNYDKMKHWYLIGIDKGERVCMNNLGHYYQNTEINYNLMKKYYLMAVDNGSTSALCNLGVYYKIIKKNYKKMRMYHMMALLFDDLEKCYNGNKIEILELYLNFQDKLTLNKIINIIDNIKKSKLTPKTIIKFKQLLSQIEFGDNIFYNNLKLFI